MWQFFLTHWHLIIGIIVGIYELFVRLIPTVANLSLIKIIIDLLKWLSDNLNVTKK